MWYGYILKHIAKKFSLVSVFNQATLFCNTAKVLTLFQEFIYKFQKKCQFFLHFGNFCYSFFFIFPIFDKKCKNFCL